MNTADALIQEFTRMIVADGLEAFTLRKLADRVGIKAPSIYVHFESKEALFAAARAEASKSLGVALAEHAGGKSRGDARNRLLNTAMAYLQFAQDQPALFALMFQETPSNRSSLDQAPDPDSPYAILLSRVREFLPADHPQSEVLSFGIWALVHGAAQLRQTHLQKFGAAIIDGTRRNLDALLDGWAVT
ncbi:TetR/AcrR family transcriptional regulator [Roseateles albus]|uniref:TetR/AcrR family transcriptional regulator n=1 Tax=Roseateles albus TaxID=2987525 RepID=A0ABT5KGN4_9BURK|nr:TetR/AcrR family transcriptional regulator [Roseateles albus]MDC8773063.1 TetR/AcrR family transcriptional regulator [Roseateles albus]